MWSAGFAYAVGSISDDLARERFAPPEKSADRIALHFIRLVSLAHIVFGALDTGRWHLFPVATPLRVVSTVGVPVTVTVCWTVDTVSRGRRFTV